jgi:S1-C subfamily serine protease
LAAGLEERGIAIAVEADDDEQGIVIAAVVDDGPAAMAGVERGDILLELDGEAVNSHVDLREVLAELEPGDEVELRVLHGDEERFLTATLDERDGQAFLGVVPCCTIREGDVTVHMPQDIVPQHIPAGGTLITDVVDDSPADEAGLKVGDIVLAVDGEELGGELTLADAIGAHQPGDEVTLTVASPAAEEEKAVTVELGEHPDREGTAYLGVAYLPSPSMRRLPFHMPQLPHRDTPPMDPDTEPFREVIPEDLPKPKATVIEVDADSPAEEAGLREGDVILSIDGETVGSPQDVVRAVTAQEPGDKLMMKILRPGEAGDGDEELELSITLGEHPDDEVRAYLGVRLGCGGLHLRRFRGECDPEGWHWEFDLPEDWHPRFHVPESWDLPFDLDELPHHFEFEFSPEDDADDGAVLPGDGSV